MLCFQSWTTVGAIALACLAAYAASSISVVLGASDYVDGQQKNWVTNVVTNFRRRLMGTHEPYYYLHDGDHTSVAKLVHAKDLLQTPYDLNHNLTHAGSGRLMTWNHEKSRLYRVRAMVQVTTTNNTLSRRTDQADLQSLYGQV